MAQETWVEPSSLQTTGVTPLLLTGLFVQLLRYQFADANNILTPQLRTRLWTPEIQTSRLLIESMTKFKPEDLALRPALLVRRDAISAQNMGIGGGRVQSEFSTVGGEMYHMLMIGSHTLFALAADAAEAELYAIEAFRFLMHFSAKIRCDFNLMRFLPASIASPIRVEECSNHHAVPVVFGYAYTESWQLIAEAPVLKTLSINVLGN